MKSRCGEGKHDCPAGQRFGDSTHRQLCMCKNLVIIVVVVVKLIVPVIVVVVVVVIVRSLHWRPYLSPLAQR